MNYVNFQKTPPLGTVVMLQGQRYELVNTELYWRIDGQPTVLLHWQSHFPDCAAAFVVVTGLRQRYLNRRCPKYHRKGAPVTASRKVVVRRSRHG
jgi:hypothetical protein